MLLAGDLADTVEGQHILAYIGRDRWIEADPGYHKVTIETVPDSDNPWFRVLCICFEMASIRSRFDLSCLLLARISHK